MTEIGTTIKGGLPVIAIGEIAGPEPDVGIFHYYIEDFRLEWFSGHEIKFAITDKEYDRICDELIREFLEIRY